MIDKRRFRFIKAQAIRDFFEPFKKQNKESQVTPGFLYALEKHVETLLERAKKFAGKETVDSAVATRAGIWAPVDEKYDELIKHGYRP